MNRRILLATVSALAVTAMAVPAAAQTTKPIGLSVRAGIIFPTSGFGRDIGRNWFGAGAEYKLMDTNFGNGQGTGNSMLTLSVDYYGKGEASSVPVMVNLVGTNNEFYYSAGAGLAFTRDEELVAGVMRGRNETNFGYALAVGYNFQQGQNPLFVEARFHGNSNTNLNAIGLYLGVRL